MYASRPLKPRWRSPYWIAFTMVVLVAVVFVAYLGMKMYLRYSNPQLDVTASYYEKTLNCSMASAGDIVEVKVLVDWHGYVLPEFKRAVRMVDPFPENVFQLMGGSNFLNYNGAGGGYQFTYLLKVINNTSISIELPKPQLYLDNIEIPLTGSSTFLELQNFSQGI
jgi:hypothetical protein